MATITKLGGVLHAAYPKGLDRRAYEDIAIARAKVDPKFKADLLSNAKQTLFEASEELLGRPLTADEKAPLKNVTITVLEETPSQKYVVIPNGQLPPK